MDGGMASFSIIAKRFMFIDMLMRRLLGLLPKDWRLTICAVITRASTLNTWRLLLEAKIHVVGQQD